jgi:hypothetical protein
LLVNDSSFKIDRNPALRSPGINVFRMHACFYAIAIIGYLGNNARVSAEKIAETREFLNNQN